MFGVACGGQLIIQVEHVDLVAGTLFVQLFYFVVTDRVEGTNAETRRRSSKAVCIGFVRMDGDRQPDNTGQCSQPLPTLRVDSLLVIDSDVIT